MNYNQKIDQQVNALNLQIYIAKARKKLFDTCIEKNIPTIAAERIAEGTFFGNNERFNLTALDVQIIDDLMEVISALQSNI